MPVIFRHSGTRFYSFSTEGNPREPIHIQAGRADAEAKAWLTPNVRIGENLGFSRRELVELLRIAELRRAEIERAWHEHFRDNSPL